jgi:THO complex subunit 3
VKALTKLEGHLDSVSQVVWDPSSPHRLATLAGERDKTVRVFDVRTSKPTLVLKMPQEYLNMAWSPDGSTIAVGSSNLEDYAAGDGDKDFMSLIDARKGKVTQAKFPYQVEEFCFSPNSRFVIMTTENGTVELYRTDEAAGVVRSIPAHTGNCYCVATDPTRRVMAVGSKDALVSVWDLQDLVCLRTLGEHSTAIRSVSFSPDGALIASSSYESHFEVSSVASGRHACTVETGGSVQSLAWQPKVGSRLVAVARDVKNDAKNLDMRQNRSDFVRLIAVPADTDDRAAGMAD